MPPYAEYKPDDEFVPMDAVAVCFEQGADALLIDRPALPPAFFDLQTGITGELVQKLTQYGVRLACVVPDLNAQSERFQEFARETNRGRWVRFFGTKSEAVGWLTRA